MIQRDIKLNSCFHRRLKFGQESKICSKKGNLRNRIKGADEKAKGDQREILIWNRFHCEEC